MAVKWLKNQIDGWLNRRMANFRGRLNRFNKSLTLFKWRFFPPPPTPETIDTYFSFRMPEKCAALAKGKGYEPESQENKYLAGNPNLMKWNAFDAAQFLIQCNHIAIVAIFQQWFNNPGAYAGPCPPPANIKPQIIMKLWLTNPVFTDDTGKEGKEKEKIEQNKEKIQKIADMLAHGALDDMLSGMIKSWSPVEIAKYIETTRLPTIGGPISRHAPVPAAANALSIVKANDPKRFGQVLDSIQGEYKGGLMKELGEKNKIANEIKKEETNWKRTEAKLNVESTIGEILAVFKNRLVEESGPVQEKQSGGNPGGSSSEGPEQENPQDDADKPSGEN